MHHSIKLVSPDISALMRGVILASVHMFNHRWTVSKEETYSIKYASKYNEDGRPRKKC